MSGSTRSDRDQIIYRAYDGRVISRQTIDLALETIEARERRRAQMQQIRSWVLVTLLVIAVIGASVAVIWWRLISPM
jgi:hypothetical protein